MENVSPKQPSSQSQTQTFASLSSQPQSRSLTNTSFAHSQTSLHSQLSSVNGGYSAEVEEWENRTPKVREARMMPSPTANGREDGNSSPGTGMGQPQNQNNGNVLSNSNFPSSRSTSASTTPKPSLTPTINSAAASNSRLAAFLGKSYAQPASPLMGQQPLSQQQQQQQPTPQSQPVQLQSQPSPSSSKEQQQLQPPPPQPSNKNRLATPVQSPRISSGGPSPALSSDSLFSGRGKEKDGEMTEVTPWSSPKGNKGEIEIGGGQDEVVEEKVKGKEKVRREQSEVSVSSSAETLESKVSKGFVDSPQTVETSLDSEEVQSKQVVEDAEMVKESGKVKKVKKEELKVEVVTDERKVVDKVEEKGVDQGVKENRKEEGEEEPEVEVIKTKRYKSRAPPSPISAQLDVVSQKLENLNQEENRNPTTPNGKSRKPRTSSVMLASEPESKSRKVRASSQLSPDDETIRNGNGRRNSNAPSSDNLSPKDAEERASVNSKRPDARSFYSSLFEYAVCEFPNPILVIILENLGYADFRPLKELSRTIRNSFHQGESKELILVRFLGSVGYRTRPKQTINTHTTRTSIPIPNGMTLYNGGRTRAEDNNPRSARDIAAARSAAADKLTAGSSVVNGNGFPERSEMMVDITLRDLDAFKAGSEYNTGEFAMFAKQQKNQPLPISIYRMLIASTQAWNRLAIYVRAFPPNPNEDNNARMGRPKTSNPSSRSPSASRPQSRRDYRAPPPPVPTNLITKPGRAPILRAWVPSVSTWMSDQEVVECEKQVFKSGVWSHLKRGDVVWNLGVSDFGNEGKLIFDGKYLRDISFTFEEIGHIPSWLNMFAFPPSYYHNVIASRSSNPLIYLGMNSFSQVIRQSLQLVQDRVEISSAQGTHTVKKFVYRSAFKITPGTIIGKQGGIGGRGPGGLEVIVDEWAGTLVIETEGTSEHANMLMSRCATPDYTPWRILRERSRPGKLWIRPVFDNEKLV